MTTMLLLSSVFLQWHPVHSWRDRRIAAYPSTTARVFSPRILIAFMKLVRILNWRFGGPGRLTAGFQRLLSVFVHFCRPQVTNNSNNCDKETKKGTNAKPGHDRD